MKDILKFRDSCQDYTNNAVRVTDDSTVSLSIGGEKVTINGGKLKQLAKDNLSKKAADEDSAEEEKEARRMSDMIYNVESITTNAAKNAFFREKLLEEERKLKKKKELEKLDEMIRKEKEKEKCIQMFLEKEAKRQRRKRLEKDTDAELTQIKAQVETQVNSLKKMYSSKMQDLDQETEKIKAEKMRELTSLKLRITSMLIDQEIKGSVSNCKHGKVEEQEAYCNARFPTTWFENKHCRVKENFCGVCCEKEFSVKFEEDRNKCI